MDKHTIAVIHEWHQALSLTHNSNTSYSVNAN